MNTTVVISNYNYEKYVGSAIDSCLDQSVPCKIIIVDDCSTDGSWKLICDYVSKSPNIIGVRLKENSGGNARGKNIGICMCDTEFVTCLDADDMLLPWSLESRLKVIGDNDFVHGWSKFIWTEDNYKKTLKKYENLISEPIEYSKKMSKIRKEKYEPRWSCVIEASTVLSRMSLYKRFGLYDEEMRWTIDREMWWRLLFHDAKRVLLDKYISIYRNHSFQVTRNRNIKDPKKCAKKLNKRKISRININSENTLLIPNYDYKKYIAEVC